MLICVDENKMFMYAELHRHVKAIVSSATTTTLTCYTAI
jgi:hypothetical protein